MTDYVTTTRANEHADITLANPPVTALAER